MIDFKLTILFFLAFTLMFQKCAAQSGGELNLGFEEWQDSSFINSTIGLEPPFEVEGRALGRLKKWGSWTYGLRTTDAYSGNFALVLSDWYGTREDYVAIGEDSKPTRNNCKDCGAPIDFKPLILKGYYKFALLGGVPSDSVSGNIEVYDSILLKRDTIGEGTIVLPSTPDVYSMFEMPIDYSAQDLTPDTIILKVSLEAASSAQGIGCGNCMYFYIDGLELLETTTSTGSTQKLQELNIFPNPAGRMVTVANKSPMSMNLMLTDLKGSSIGHFYLPPSQVHQFDMSALSTGIYFLRSPFTTYKIIKLE